MSRPKFKIAYVLHGEHSFCQLPRPTHNLTESHEFPIIQKKTTLQTNLYP